MRVLLACEPPLLNELLALALGELPGVELVDSDSAWADVVVANEPGASATWQTARQKALALHARLVAVDPRANVIQIWEWDHDKPTSEWLPGTLRSLGELCQAKPPERTNS